MKKWTIIILGITGDLSKRKLLPALYALLRAGLQDCVIIGTGREDVTADDILNAARPFVADPTDELDRRFRDMLVYQPLLFSSRDDFEKLATLITEVEHERNLPHHRIAYLATATQFFCDITSALVDTGIIKARDLNQRVVYEKPFGSDLASAQEINACIKAHLSEKQVYRIDHYLAKEFTNNLLLLRYSNTLFKAIWDNKSIESVRIIFHETLTVEGRGAFYDQYGALKDVVQNHMLQLLALVAMEAPTSLDADAIRDKKSDILKHVRIIDGVRGQYEGYTDEPDVRADSQTETFAVLNVEVDHPMWEGVPFFLETGKALAQKTTEIELTLKPMEQCLWSPTSRCESNVLRIHITPEEGFSLRINSKKPGTIRDIMAVDFDFSYKAIYGPTSPEAYEILFAEIMRGEQSMVVRFDEVEYQWRIMATADALNMPLFVYKKGSKGPQQRLTVYGKEVE